MKKKSGMSIQLGKVFWKGYCNENKMVIYTNTSKWMYC
jgi:hypothetical protein